MPLTGVPGSRATSTRATTAIERTVSMAAARTEPTFAKTPTQPTDQNRAGARGAAAQSASITQAFSLLLPSKSGAVFFQHGRSLVLPLFTGWNEAAAFLIQSKMHRCWIIELPDEKMLIEFLRSPPGRTLSRDGDFLVSVDPIDLMNLTASLFTAREVISALGRPYKGI